jgi:hypothetical protein
VSALSRLAELFFLASAPRSGDLMLLERRDGFWFAAER